MKLSETNCHSWAYRESYKIRCIALRSKIERGPQDGPELERKSIASVEISAIPAGFYLHSVAARLSY